MRRYLFYSVVIILISSCSNHRKPETNNLSVDYFNATGRDDVLSGGIKMIPITTPSGSFKVWTKRMGNNPRIKVLLLHGGPGVNHTYFQCFDSFFPKEGFEYYYYDQLGSAYSDQPNDTSLWNTDRFVEEVEQVRQALHLDKDNLYILGHSWGGILAIEYALKYQEHIKGLIISNMVSSIPDYVKYAKEVLGPQLDPAILKEIKNLEANDEYDNPRYLELVETYFYPEHVLHMPIEQWPEPVTRSLNGTNPQIYVSMQGPSEFGITDDAKLRYWDRSADLSKITVPTLTIGGKYDTMDPEHMKWMATQVQHGRYLYCPNGAHLSMYDDQETYFKGVIQFIKDVDEDTFEN